MRIENSIADVLRGAKRPALLLSFGKDSLLLLHLTRTIRPDIALYYFGDDLSLFASQTVIENRLTVYRYAPYDRYLIPTDTGMMLVDEFVINDTLLPLLSPVVESDKCKHRLSTKRTREFGFQHDVTLWGYKRADRNAVVTSEFARENVVGGTRLIAPLYEMTDEDVYAELEARKIPYQNERNEVEWCRGCINSVTQGWDREASLRAFRQKYSFI